jgi:hypothetical protein
MDFSTKIMGEEILWRMMKTSRRNVKAHLAVVIKPKHLCIFLFIWFLLAVQRGFARLQADINADGVANFEDLAILANEWLSDSNEAILNPVIVRDIFYDGTFYVFIPADNEGKYWWRQSLRRVGNSGYKAKNYPIDEAFFGIVRPGKWQDYSRCYAVSSAWSSDAANGWPLYYAHTPGKWIEWKIPDGHNRIHAIVRTCSTYGTLNLTLGTTSGGNDLSGELDKTSINLANDGPDKTITEIVVATKATSSGEKYLRFTLVSGTMCEIVGVHSFDDDAIGDPSTLDTDNLAMGHDLVDTVADWMPSWSEISGQEAYKILKSNTCELTISWEEATQTTYKWTSYGCAHYRSGPTEHTCADFIATTKPTLYIGGNSISTLDDTATIPRGKLYNNAQISLYVKGFGDYDEDGSTTPGTSDVMQAEICSAISAQGIDINTSITWTANSNTDRCYVPSIPLLDGSSGFVTFPPDPALIKYVGDAIKDYDVEGATWSEIYPDNIPCIIVAQSLGPNAKIFEQTEAGQTKCKQYHSVDLSHLIGGTAPPADTVWTLGGHIAVVKTNKETLLKADINADGVVNFEDLAILANEWLKDSVPPLGLVRDSIAYDANFRELPKNVGRYEDICVASRPDVILNTSELVAHLDVDEDAGLLLAGYVNILKTSPDGQNFTKIADITKDEPFVSNLNNLNDSIKSIKILPDGSWLVALGKKEPGNQGNLFRSMDKGRSWSHVLKFDSGYPEQFGYALADNKVAVVEYGYNGQENNPRSVYYSDDYGATWAKIYDPGAHSGQHGHCLSFAPGDTNTIYVSYGDGNCSEVIKIENSGGVWSKTATIAKYNPVCAFSDGAYIYFGHDKVGTDPVIWRLDPADDSRKDVLRWPEYRYNSNYPYRYQNPHGDVYSMLVYNGVYYAAVRDEDNHHDAGIYVSTDGVHWVCAHRVEGVDGFLFIAGYANGYLWGIYSDGDSGRLYKMSPVNAKIVNALRLERGITNILNTPSRSSFEDDNGGWKRYSTNHDIDLTEGYYGRSNVDALHGDYCFLFTAKDNGAGHAKIISDYWPTKPSLNGLICASFWIKGCPTWPLDYSAVASIYVYNKTATGSIDSEPTNFEITKEWQKITLWGKCTDANWDTCGPQLWIDFYDNGWLTGIESHDRQAQCYIDACQIVYFPDQYYNSSWQIGGTPRANETATGSLVGLGAEFTTTFEWRPDCSSREWHGNIYIASWTDGDENIDFYYDNATSKFVATDGTNTAVTTQTFSWEHFDSIKLALTNMGGDFRLSVQTPLNGVEHVLTNNGDTKLGPPVAVTFDTYSRRTSYGCGLIANVKHFDLPLTISEIQKLFDLVETSGR